MKANTYEILQKCVEEGIQYGYNRSFKHLEEGQHPTRDALAENIQQAIFTEICLYFSFEDGH